MFAGSHVVAFCSGVFVGSLFTHVPIDNDVNIIHLFMMAVCDQAHGSRDSILVPYSLVFSVLFIKRCVSCWFMCLGIERVGCTTEAMNLKVLVVVAFLHGSGLSLN